MNRTRMRLAAVAAAAAVAPAAQADATTLEGTCRLTGTLEFRPTLGNEPREFRFRDHAAGTCTGRLDGVSRVDVPVALRAKGSGTGGCLAGQATSTGTLTFATGEKLRFWTQTTGGLTQYVSRWGGAVSGEALAEVDVLTANDPSTPAACEAGTLESVGYDLATQTITPVVG